MKNKSRKSKTWRKLYLTNWLLCHDIVDLRDGHKCQIPDCDRQIVDLDHVFSRTVKALFFEPDNLAYLCSGEHGHHCHKSFRHGGWVDKKVNDLCRERVGQDRWEWLMFAAKRLCPEFCNIGYQETVNRYLQERLSELKGERGV